LFVREWLENIGKADICRTTKVMYFHKIYMYLPVGLLAQNRSPICPMMSSSIFSSCVFQPQDRSYNLLFRFWKNMKVVCGSFTFVIICFPVAQMEPIPPSSRPFNQQSHRHNVCWFTHTHTHIYNYLTTTKGYRTHDLTHHVKEETFCSYIMSPGCSMHR
jgi:hypothetical protein